MRTRMSTYQYTYATIIHICMYTYMCTHMPFKTSKQSPMNIDVPVHVRAMQALLRGYRLTFARFLDLDVCLTPNEVNKYIAAKNAIRIYISLLSGWPSPEIGCKVLAGGPKLEQWISLSDTWPAVYA